MITIIILKQHLSENISWRTVNKKTSNLFTFVNIFCKFVLKSLKVILDKTLLFKECLRHE